MKTLYRDNKAAPLAFRLRRDRCALSFPRKPRGRQFQVYSVTLPSRQFLGRACLALPFSVAELLYVLAAVTAVVLLVLMVLSYKVAPKGRAAYRCALFVLDLFLTVCAAFSLLWGANYYLDGFCDRSDLSPEPVAYDDLVRVTQYFADHLARRRRTSRAAASNLFTADRQVLDYADTVYDCLYDEFPFLDMPDQKPKRAFSFEDRPGAMNFTGCSVHGRGQT